MKSYSDKEMADRNDPKWLMVNGVEPKIASALLVDVIRLFCFPGLVDAEKLSVHEILWESVAKYRLHNGEGFRDGIAIDNDTLISDEKKRVAEFMGRGEWVDGLPPVGTVCEFKIALSWKKCRILGNVDNGDMWIENLNDAELYTETCMSPEQFRPIKSQRDKVIEEAAQKINYGGMTNDVDQAFKIAEKLYAAGLLSMPEGDK